MDRNQLAQLMAQRRRVPADAYNLQELSANALAQFPNMPDEITLSGGQSTNMEPQADADWPVTRTDMEHLSPGWSDWDFLHKRHGMDQTPVAEQARGQVSQPKAQTNLATLLDSASGNPNMPLMPGSTSAFSGAVPPNWSSVGATRPGLRLAPWNVDWSQ